MKHKKRTELKELVTPLYTGFMRFITLNVKLWFKPVELGWRRKKNE